MSDPLTETSARYAMRKSWGPGDHLTDGHTVIEITARGYEAVLARQVYDDGTPGRECVWSLLERDWRLEKS